MKALNAELLEACEDALYRIEWDSFTLGREETRELAILRAVIAKAKGEAAS